MNNPKEEVSMKGRLTIDDVMFYIEDYVGGNIEGVEEVDRMGFTVFLRSQLSTLLQDSNKELIERIIEGLPEPEIVGGARFTPIPVNQEYINMVRNQVISEVKDILIKMKGE